MGEVEDALNTSSDWPSVDDARPAEEGGPVARTGFNYQDEIAVGILIDMLESPSVQKVHCETHDDIVVVELTNNASSRTAGYVQVKAGGEDKLWSVADLCQRKKRKVGTSIFEKSLARDCHVETPYFRIVTLNSVAPGLKPLTYDAAAPDRAPGSHFMTTLAAEIDRRMPGIRSPKGNDARFWLQNCRWDVRHSEEAVRTDNIARLVRLCHRTGQLLFMEQIDALLDDLRARVKVAGAARWGAERDKKIITRAALLEWWRHRTQELIEGIAQRSGGKLADKMRDANLRDDQIEMALDLRRRYAAEVRTPRYLEADDIERLNRRAHSEVTSLRAQHLSGDIALDPLGFHALCLQRMDDLNASRMPRSEDASSFLKGCVYDIADRCMLRFTGPAS